MKQGTYAVKARKVTAPVGLDLEQNGLGLDPQLDQVHGNGERLYGIC